MSWRACLHTDAQVLLSEILVGVDWGMEGRMRSCTSPRAAFAAVQRHTFLSSTCLELFTVL